MSAERKVTAVVPARGGSKGIPRKNVRPLAGRPLIEWTLRAATRADCVGRTVVTTDDEEIAGIARESRGAEVPFVRPPELARDDTPMADVVDHALSELDRRGWSTETFLLLQPTSPLRTAGDIDRAAQILLSDEVGGVVGLCPVIHHPMWMKMLDGEGWVSPLLDGEVPVRRQDLSEVYALNGAIFGATREYWEQHRNFCGPRTRGYVMPRERSVDVDDEMDWAVAEMLAGDRPGDR